MSEPIFNIERVSYRYSDKYIGLRDINMRVEEGESLAILGANGSGKSTLLKILAGLAFPSQGKITALGRPLTPDALAGDFSCFFRSKLGFVFQEPDVQIFCPTVWDEIAFGPLQLDMPKDEVRQRVEDTLDMLGIKGLRDRQPHHLSGGEKKKVAIGSVLSLNPDILLLDEPTNGLDPRTQVWLFELLEGLRRFKKTIVMATHDLSIAEDLTDRVVVLNEEHTVVSHGRPAEILRDKDLLLRVNIIHEHTHRHGDITHIHSHGPFASHDEHDEKQT
ncbi:MAG: ABC transporter ATP-binding protein [Deltaproteobacteria bacterium]|nr:ABC transporter ATP-binding protein [Deltaproteobacteria bacterium]